MKMDTGDELYRIGDKLYHVQAGEMIIDSINETEISVTIKLGNRKGYTFPLREFGKKIFFSKEHARKRDSFIHCPDDYFIFAEVERRLEREKATKEREEERIAREEEQIAREEAAAIADVQSYLYEHFHENNRPFQVDQEQANAIARKEKDILVAARAGSGKTRVIVGKTLYCLEKMDVPENAIRILSFNKNVREEIADRIRNAVQSMKPASINREKLPDPQTFHRYAMRLAGIEGGILANDEIEERTRLISRIIKSLSEEDALFSEQIYKFFRKENAEIKEEFFHGNVKSYYSYIRNQHYQTLRGGYVRSKGEKWLADFFFEHGINYQYERSFYPSYIKPELLVGDDIDADSFINFLNENKNYKGESKAIRPDFYLPEHDMVWEHWGINEKGTSREEIIKFGEKFKLRWAEYYRIMQWKRNFWNDYSHLRESLQAEGKNAKHIEAIKQIQRMIETSIVDMQPGREYFEQCVNEKLCNAGIEVRRRPMDEIIREVFEKHNGITRFSEQIRSFIDKYQQRYFDDECGFVTQMNKTHIKNDPRTHAFLSMGLKVLKRYEEILKAAVKPKGYESWADYRFDFNQVLFEAIKKIKAGGCSDRLKPLQYILVDEYQDFSKLFFEFIQAIREQNNHIQLFCVGDNWQAINRFAGSDTVYFENFKGKFPSGIRVDMSTNYRSGREIIEKSNNFMRVIDNDALPAKPRSDPPPPKSLIVTIDVSDMWIEQRPGQEYAKERAADKKYIDLFYYQQGKNNKDHDYPIKAQYMKKCVEIIKENPGKSVLILHRKKSFKISIELSEFKEKLHKALKDNGICPEKPHEQIKVMTIHKSKGLEADVVVILEANQYVIPNIHPDNVLYSVFGETPTVTLTDERRLFYVAVTRAKEKCYILYEQERKSDFITEYSWETIEANNYIEDVDDTALPF